MTSRALRPMEAPLRVWQVALAALVAAGCWWAMAMLALRVWRWAWA